MLTSYANPWCSAVNLEGPVVSSHMRSSNKRSVIGCLPVDRFMSNPMSHELQVSAAHKLAKILPFISLSKSAILT
uniref:Uncharacterized protein n=1 Tax=Leptobrachium leishanense TaxID=445787 RepID=A0A8C5QSK7_9ANUR